eukprot:8838064-Lingulodinium_polyedra.AAC.1
MSLGPGSPPARPAWVRGSPRKTQLWAAPRESPRSGASALTSPAAPSWQGTSTSRTLRAPWCSDPPLDQPEPLSEPLSDPAQSPAS